MIRPMQRVAVADMGSNSWRLVVFGYEPGTPWWSLVDEIREAVRVGAGMGEEGVLRPDRIDRALHTAAVFASFCRASGIDQVEAVATSAIRDAVNGGELLDAIRDQTGLDPRVISGAEEARYDWLAIANSTTIEDGFGLDIGGGSIQTLRLEDRRLAQAESLRLGSVRVSEEFLPGEKASAKAVKALRKKVAAELGALGWWEGGGRLVGVGGTIRNLAAAAMKRAGLPALDVQGFELTRDALEDIVEWLADRPASKRGDMPGIKPDRGDVILGGALVLAAGLHELDAHDRELLWAACVLHDIGTAIDYDDHHRHSQYLILNAGLPGFTPRELVMVGLIARYHRKGDPDTSELGPLEAKGDRERLQLLCAIIRLAEQLERSRDGAIRQVRVAAHDGTVELDADVDPARDPSVPISAARWRSGEGRRGPAFDGGGAGGPGTARR